MIRQLQTGAKVTMFSLTLCFVSFTLSAKENRMPILHQCAVHGRQDLKLKTRTAVLVFNFMRQP